jgi:hypothetical protein
MVITPSGSAKRQSANRSGLSNIRHTYVVDLGSRLQARCLESLEVAVRDSCGKASENGTVILLSDCSTCDVDEVSSHQNTMMCRSHRPL